MKDIKDDVKLLDITINEFKDTLYSYYLDIFPKTERKSLERIEICYNKRYTKILKILDNTTLIGFMTINRVKDNGYVILDYFAILPQYQNKGFGTKALELLIKQEKLSKGIFIEIEKVGLGKNEEEDLVRYKRQKFYENVGFMKLNFDLLLLDITYMPYIFSNVDINEESIIKEIFNIYELILGKDEVKRNCKVIRIYR